MKKIKLKFDQFKRKIKVNGIPMSFCTYTTAIEEILKKEIKSLTDLQPCSDKAILLYSEIKITINNGGHKSEVKLPELKGNTDKTIFFDNFFKIRGEEEAFDKKCEVLAAHIQGIIRAVKREVETLENICTKVHISKEI